LAEELDQQSSHLYDVLYQQSSLPIDQERGDRTHEGGFELCLFAYYLHFPHIGHTAFTA
jgi:hypothetical protein